MTTRHPLAKRSKVEFGRLVSGERPRGRDEFRRMLQITVDHDQDGEPPRQRHVCPLLHNAHRTGLKERSRREEDKFGG